MTRQLHAAVPTSETPGADCKDVRDLYHPLNSCGAQVVLPQFYAFGDYLVVLKLGETGTDFHSRIVRAVARATRPVACRI